MKIESANQKDRYLYQIRHFELYYFNDYYLGTKAKKVTILMGCLRVEKSFCLISSKDEGLGEQQIWKMRKLHSGFFSFSASTLRE